MPGLFSRGEVLQQEPNIAGRGSSVRLLAPLQAAATSYKSLYGATLNRGPRQGQELLHFCLNGTSARRGGGGAEFKVHFPVISFNYLVY